MLFSLLYHQAVGIRVRSCLNSSSYRGDPKEKMVLVAILKTAGGPRGLNHAKRRQPGSSFPQCTSIVRERCVL